MYCGNDQIPNYSNPVEDCKPTTYRQNKRVYSQRNLPPLSPQGPRASASLRLPYPPRRSNHNPSKEAAR